MTDREALAITSNVTVKIQRPLEEIPGGSAIFFEFKHYKAKKNFISTRCFSFMEMDEIKPGRTYLEMLVCACVCVSVFLCCCMYVWPSIWNVIKDSPNKGHLRLRSR